MSRSRVVIVGAGFAGYHAARALTRHRGLRDETEIVLINPTDYFLYLPLLPQVASGVLDPRRVTVSLPSSLPDARLVLGEVDGVDLDGHAGSYTDPEGNPGTMPYDRLVLTVGSVNKLLPIPGIADHAHGFRSMAEAMYLRDQLIRQVELADLTDSAQERRARLTFVVVGAGYTGTEVAAYGQLLTESVVAAHPRLDGWKPTWLLLDTADHPLPGLDPRLSRTAERELLARGMDLRMGVSVKEAVADGVHLSTGDFVPTRTLVWCVGVRPDPFVDSLGLRTMKGRVVVDEYLAVPGQPRVFACGDAAAVPDLTRPGEVTAMTAQHAQRQGKLVARNIAAAYGVGKPRPYRHHDLGFTVDLGGGDAAANPLSVSLSGPVAAAVTLGYHLLALPANRPRVIADWVLGAVEARQPVQLGVVEPTDVPLETTH
jgi:NADH dehydrogenase